MHLRRLKLRAGSKMLRIFIAHVIAVVLESVVLQLENASHFLARGRSPYVLRQLKTDLRAAHSLAVEERTTHCFRAKVNPSTVVSRRTRIFNPCYHLHLLIPHDINLSKYLY